MEGTGGVILDADRVLIKTCNERERDLSKYNIAAVFVIFLLCCVSGQTFL